MDEKNQLTILIQNLKTEIDKAEKEIRRNEMDTQVCTAGGDKDQQIKQYPNITVGLINRMFPSTFTINLQWHSLYTAV